MVSVGHVNFDLTSIIAVRDEAERALERGDLIILDLRGVEFIDTSGLGTISRLMRQAEAGRFVVLGVGLRLNSLFLRLPLQWRPPAYDSVEDARQSLRSLDDIASRTMTQIRLVSDHHLPNYQTTHA